MNTYDPQKAARVWQRVQNSQVPEKTPDRHENLQELIMNEWLCAATYLRLSRQMGPREAPVLQRLGREEQNHATCLRGIYNLITGEQSTARWPQPSVDAPEVTLRRCYAAHMRSLKEYESRSADPEYGPVFARLAQQERDQCRTVLELIGRLGRKQS